MEFCKDCKGQMENDFLDDGTLICANCGNVEDKEMSNENS